MLTPKGSGTKERPIKIISVGTGSRPVIDASGFPGSVLLYNVEGWEIDGINMTGGTNFGIFIGADYTDGRFIENFTVRNCSAYKVGPPRTAEDEKDPPGGLMLASTHAPHNDKHGAFQFRNLIFENCEAYDTTTASGIVVSGTHGVLTRSENITIQNCFVHDVCFNGILTLSCGNVIIKDNVAFQTGINPVHTGHTPNSIWTWRCTNALVSGNEAAFAHSPESGKDGGAFDIDYYNRYNTYEYNYAHDNDSYGISIMASTYEGGAPDPADPITVGSIVRHNVFAHNVTYQNDKGTVISGEIDFCTWWGGSIDGFEIHDNIIISKPADPKNPAIWIPVTRFSGELPRVFKNNTVYSDSGIFMIARTTEKMEFSGNRYYSGTDGFTAEWGGIGADFENEIESTPKTKPEFVFNSLDEFNKIGQEIGSSFTKGANYNEIFNHHGQP
jgi:hypothetical protein